MEGAFTGAEVARVTGHDKTSQMHQLKAASLDWTYKGIWNIFGELGDDGAVLFHSSTDG
jgi:hypothetical protein